jgi:hypothetical protein
MKLTTKARVLVTLEIDLDGTWGQDCKTEQVYKQAGDEVRGKISSWRTSQYDKTPTVHARIIGEPKITAILQERE